jgi:ATP-dependent helicase HrpB
MTDLPIDAILPDLRAALRTHGRAVLQAPPGAGKTTRVPLALLPDITGKILMLEPRRLAARGAAARMADTLGERLGQTVGYRMRGEAQVSKSTRIEVVTEGILTAMLQSDPELSGVDVVIFDEFHERSLTADLGLALTWEVRNALREDLAIVVMSATLDAAPVAALLADAPVLTAEGRAYPVDIRYRDRPLPQGQRYEAAMAGLIHRALEEVPEGSCLVFLPGVGEINRVMSALGALPRDVTLHKLYGAMPFKDQQTATRPPTSGRNLVLSTAIAETSLTLPDIRVVVDGGRARRARFDPARGMSQLVTERVTRAEATQRAGRAGRVAAGVCYRHWSRGEDGGLSAFPPPEIAAADLAGLALELALWGSPDGAALAFLTPPPEGLLREAQALLEGLGAVHRGQITAHGRALAKLPLHPRLAHMVFTGGPGSADLAALLSDRDPLPRAGVDTQLRLDALRGGRADPALARLRHEAKRLRKYEAGAPDQSPAQQAARAYPDRIGLRRTGDAPRWQLSGGPGARMEAGDTLASARLLVALDLDGDRREARLRQALSLSEAELRAVHGDAIQWEDLCAWDSRARRVQARKQERFMALVLNDQTWPEAPPERVAEALLEGIRDLGIDCLNWSPKAQRLRARIAISALRDVSDEALLATLEDWALPYLSGKRTAADLKQFDPTEALTAWLGWDDAQRMAQLAPAHYTSPMGRNVPIDYSSGTPEVALRLQEVFGETRHPVTGPNRTPLRMILLSPGQKPVQVTQDLPGFWATSYADVRKDMRGRYPRHPWPEDPTQADPTLRAKPRGT